MKKITTILFVLSSVVMLSCSSDDDNGGGQKKEVSTGQIEIQAYTNLMNYDVAFFARADEISIDWGGGAKQDFSPNGEKLSFPFTYSTTALQEISVVAKNLTEWSNTFADTINFHSASRFKSVAFDNCNDLRVLNISHNPTLTDLDVSGCESLVTLMCSNNHLSTLNLSQNTELTTLFCSSNVFSYLDISNNKKLKTLICSYNYSLTGIDVSENTDLVNVDFRNNRFSSTAINAIFNNLPTRQLSDSASIYIYGNPGLADTVVPVNEAIAINKGWRVY